MYYNGYPILGPDQKEAIFFKARENDSFELRKIKEFTLKILDNLPFIDDKKTKATFPIIKQLAYMEIYVFLYVLTDFIFVEKEKNNNERRKLFEEINKFFFECIDWYNYNTEKRKVFFDNRVELYGTLIQSQKSTLNEDFYRACFKFQAKLFSKEIFDKKLFQGSFEEINNLPELKPIERYCSHYLYEIKHHILAFLGELEGIDTTNNKQQFINSLKNFNSIEKYNKIIQVIDKFTPEDILNCYSIKLKENNILLRSHYVFFLNEENAFNEIKRILFISDFYKMVEYPNDKAQLIYTKNNYLEKIDFTPIENNYLELLCFTKLLEEYKNVAIHGSIISNSDEIEKYKNLLKNYPFYNEDFISSSYPFIKKTDYDLFIGYFEEKLEEVSYIVKRIDLKHGNENIVSCIVYRKIHLI